MDIERIKSTPLGRAWLSRFVERVWENVMATHERNRLLWDATAPGGRSPKSLSPTDIRGLYIIRWGSRSSADGYLVAMGLLADDGHLSRRCLTPLGVEVYLHGHREARNHRARPEASTGYVCSGPMGGPGTGPMRRVS